MAAGGITAAAVWVDVIPSMRGAARELSKQARTMGQQSGRALADETAREVSRGTSRIGGAMRSAFDRVQAAAVTAGNRIGQAFSAGFTTAQNALGRFRQGWSALDTDTARAAGRIGRFGAAARTAFDTAARPIQNFTAGLRSSDAAASALTGRMGTLGGRARTALDVAARPVQNLVAGFRDSDAAASAFTGRLGTMGGAARSALNSAAAPVQNLVAGFRSSDAAASAFTGRMGTVGGAVRSAMTGAAAPVQNLVAGFRSSDAAASAFTGRMGTVGGAIRSGLGSAVQPVHNLVAGFRSSEAAASAFSGRMGTVGGAIRSAMTSASSSLSNLSANVRNQAAEMQTAISDRVGGALAALPMRAAGAAAAAAAVGTIGTAALGSAANIQNVELTLSGMYGSAADATDMMQRLTNLSRNSPIDYSAYANAANQLAYMGYKGEQAEGVLRNIGAAITAAGGSGEGMQRASAALLQMVNSGRVYAAQLGQISDAGIPIFSGLAAHFDTNIENVRTMVTEGKVGIEDVMSVIENASGDTYQSMLAASEQVTGSMSNQWAILKDNIITGLGQAAVPITTALAPAIGTLGARIGESIGRLPDLLARIGASDWFQGIVAGLRAVWEFIGPVVEFLGRLALTTAGVVLTALGHALGAVGNALAFILPYLRPLQPLIVGIAVGLAAWFGAIKVFSLFTSGLAMIRVGITGVMTAWRLLSLAFAASPIGFVITVVIALVAAVIYAYSEFEWFRNIVHGAWQWIKDAAVSVYNGFLLPIFNGIVAALNWCASAWTWLVGAAQAAWAGIAAGANWLWLTILQPVFNAIWLGIQFLAAILFTVLVTPWILAFNLIAAVANWLWLNALQPAFAGIGAAATWLWVNVLSPVWNALVAALRWVGSIFTWLYVNVVLPVFGALAAFIQFAYYSILLPVWNALVAALRWVGSIFTWLYYNVVMPIWNFIGAAINFAYYSVILPAYNALVAGIRWVGSIFTWLYENVVRPVWDAMGAAINWVWLNVISPAFEAVKTGLQWLGEKFDQVTNWIGDIWNKIRGFLAKPINFMINTVWNSGIVPAWNAVAAILPGVDPIAGLDPIPEARTGGRVDSRGMIRGPGTGTSDSILGRVKENDAPVRVSNREFIVNERATRRHLPLLTALNGGANIGDRRNERRAGLIPAFAGGGPVGWQDLWATVRGQFPNARLTSAQRNTNDYHGAGTAIDIAGPRSMDMPFMLNVNRWIAGAFPSSAELIHTQPGAVNLKNGRPHTYNAGTRAGHVNHVHWANNGGAAGEGGWFSAISTWFRDQVQALFVSATDPVLDGIRGLLPAPPPVWNKVPAELAVTMRDKMSEWLFSKADEEDSKAGAGGGVDISGISGPVVDQVRQVAARYGWGDGPEWEAIKWIVQKESTWDPGAANSRSSARGLFQKMTSYHGPVEPTPAGQANWGLNYIRGRYGSPTAAKAFHMANGSYDAGGVAYGRGVMLKDIIAPERVLPPRETQAYETLTRLSQRLDSGVVRVNSIGDDRTGQAAGGAGQGGVHLHVHGDVHDPVDVDVLSQRLEFATRAGRF